MEGSLPAGCRFAEDACNPLLADTVATPNRVLADRGERFFSDASDGEEFEIGKMTLLGMHGLIEVVLGEVVIRLSIRIATKSTQAR